MKKQFYLKSLLSLLLLFVGMNAWGEDVTMTFVQNSTTTGTLTGAPKGVTVTATFNNTYTNNKEQITSGNTMTLTISGITADYSVKAINLKVKNNASKGSGTATATMRDTKFADLSITGLGSTYQTKAMTLSSTPNGGSDLVIKLTCSTNSVYCKQFDITLTKTEVVTKNLTSIAVSEGANIKKIYKEGQSFDTSGLIVTGTYDDNTQATITTGITWDVTPNPLTAGTTSIKVKASVGNVVSELTTISGLNVTESYKYELVTDASTLMAGDVITFVNGSNAIGEEKTNNFGIVSVTINENVFDAPDGLSSFTLYGSENAWYFKDVNNKYLYAASSSSNYLKTQSSKDNNSKAKITISNNNATIQFQGSNSNKLLRYNSDNSLFSCYASGQQPVQIYRMLVATPASDEITISDALYATYYNSNLAYTMPSDCKGYVFTVTKGLELAYDEGEIVPAGEPLVISSTVAGKKTLVYNESTEQTYKSGDMNDLDGVDVETALSADENFYFYGLSLNAQSELNSVGFYWVNDGGAAFTVPAHKAYLKVAKQSGAKSFFLFNDGEVTGINSVNAIDETAPVYNVQGQRVVASTKGIVIQNGRKFFNK